MLPIQNSTMSGLAVGAAVTLGASLACIKWVAPLGWVDHPDSRKQHGVPTARTAGLALWVLLLGLLLLGISPLPLNRAQWVGVQCMTLIGLLDDRFNLRSRHKAMVGLGVALLLAVNMAPSLSRLTPEIPFLGMRLTTHPLLVVPLLTLWFWSIPQAMNLIDGLNGLSMGFCLILTVLLAGVMGHAPAGGYLSGGLLVTFLLNYPRARHFLGDCGSLMLGTLFAILLAKAFVATNANLMLWVMAYPTVDVTLVVSVRKWKGLPLGSADRNHLHHYLVDHFGRGRAWVVTPILLALAFLPMARAMAFPGHDVISFLGLVCLVVLAVGAFRNRVTSDQKVVPLQPRTDPKAGSGPNQVA